MSVVGPIEEEDVGTRQEGCGVEAPAADSSFPETGYQRGPPTPYGELDSYPDEIVHWILGLVSLGRATSTRGQPVLPTKASICACKNGYAK